VEVDVQVALGADGEVEQPVPGQRGQHVVEEADAGGMSCLPVPSRFRVTVMSVSVVVRVIEAVRSMGECYAGRGFGGSGLWGGVFPLRRRAPLSSSSPGSTR